MISNEYIKEITTPLDEAFFIERGLETVTPQWLRTPCPMALRDYTSKYVMLVDQHPYLQQLRDKFPKLRYYVELMKFEPGVIPIHIDNKRQCALNIPISNCNEQTTTTFYKDYQKVDVSYEPFGDVPAREWKSSEFINYVKDGKPAFAFQFHKPVLFNTSEPHGIVNKSRKARLIWTWTCDDTFENMKEMIP